MSARLSPASGAVPRGSEVDHANPDEFVVRCTACGRIGRKDGRGRAHRLADNHALRCSQTGVTPVSSSASAPTVDAAETAVADGGLEVTETDLHGEEIVVEYDSVSERATRQRIAGGRPTAGARPPSARHRRGNREMVALRRRRRQIGRAHV